MNTPTCTHTPTPLLYAHYSRLVHTAHEPTYPSVQHTEYRNTRIPPPIPHSKALAHRQGHLINSGLLVAGSLPPLNGEL